MIEAVHSKKEQAKERAARSTHPAYTEYSWDSLARQQMPSQSRQDPRRMAYPPSSAARTVPGMGEAGYRPSAASHRPMNPSAMPNARTGQARKTSASGRTGSSAQAGRSAAVKTAGKPVEKKAIRKKTVTMFHTIVASVSETVV